MVGLVEQVEDEWNEEAAAKLTEYEALEQAGELASLDTDELAELRKWEALAKAIKPRRRMLRDDAVWPTPSAATAR